LLPSLSYIFYVLPGPCGNNCIFAPGKLLLAGVDTGLKEVLSRSRAQKNSPKGGKRTKEIRVFEKSIFKLQKIKEENF